MAALLTGLICNIIFVFLRSGTSDLTAIGIHLPLFIWLVHRAHINHLNDVLIDFD
jgi:hypothetical protein